MNPESDLAITLGTRMRLMRALCNLALSVLLASGTSCPAQSSGTNLLKEFFSLLGKGADTNWDSAQRFALSLPRAEQFALGKQLINQTNGRVVYCGANLLIDQGKEKEAMGALVRLLVDGRAESDLKGRLGYDWVHTKSDSEAGRLFYQLAAAAADAYEPASEAGRTRIEQFCTGLGLGRKGGAFSAADAKKHALEKINQLKTRQTQTTNQLEKKK